MQVFWFIVSGARYLLNSLCVTVNIVFFNVSEIKTLFNFLLLFSWWWNRCHHMLLLEKQVAWAKLRRWWKLDIDPTFLMFIQDSNINPWTPGRLLVWSKMDKLSDQTVSKWMNLWLKKVPVNNLHWCQYEIGRFYFIGVLHKATYDTFRNCTLKPLKQ